MYDNGLLEYYRSKKYEDGLLDVNDLEILESKDYRSIHHPVKKLKTPIGDFFQKRVYTKENMDREILLSQIYNKFGVTSAVYTPAKTEESSKILLSNSLEGENIYPPILKFNGVYKNGFYEFDERRFPAVMLDGNRLSYFLKYYNRDFLEDLLKIRILDVASEVNDRYSKKLLFKVEDKITDVLIYDHEESDDREKGDYFHDFYVRPRTMMRWEFMEKMKENKIVNTLIDKPKIAEEIRQINPFSVAEDIENNTGYIVEEAFCDHLAFNYDRMAKDLTR